MESNRLEEGAVMPGSPIVIEELFQLPMVNSVGTSQEWLLETLSTQQYDHE